MIVRTKKRMKERVARLEGEGKIEEFFVKEDIMDPKRAKVEICFRGDGSSGIVEMSMEEVEKLNDLVYSKLKIPKGIKIIKSKK